MKKIIFALLMLVSWNAFASGVISLDANKAPYSSLPAAQGTSIQNDPMARAASMTAMVGAYAASKGKLPTAFKDQVFEFTWTDGSKERGIVVSPLSSVGVVPIEGTQSKPPGGGVGYTNDGGGHYYGGADAIGFRPVYQTVTTCVGDYCESITIVTGYEWVFAPGRGPGNEAV